MKSLIKSLIVGLICIAVVLNAASKAVCFEDREDGCFDSESNMPDSRLDQKDALKAYSTLRQYFNLDNKGCVISYPESYGGSYINDENELVLRITAYDAWVNNAIQNIESKNESIKIELCEASLNDVVGEYLSIKDSLPREKINCSYYSDSMNSYVLRCYKENEGIIRDSLKENNASDRITIQIDEEKCNINNTLGSVTPELRTSYLYGGIFLYSGQSFKCTMGICGSYGNYNHCYLTAGHAALNNCHIGPTTSSNDQYAALLCQYEDLGIGDYAVVPAPSYFVKSNEIYTSDNLTRTAVTKYYIGTDYPQNLTLYKFGRATLLTYGTIIGTSFSTYSAYMIGVCDMIVVQHSSNPFINAPGDSGGPCWIINGDDEILFIGTVSGGLYDQGNNYMVTMYVSPIKHAVDNGFTPYNMTAVTSFD